MSQVWALFKELFKRQWWWVTLLVLIMMAILARLGFWQLARLEQRRTENQEMAAALNVPPIELDRGFLNGDTASLENLQMEVSGEFDNDQQVILKLQKWQEQHGFHLLTPLVMDDGQTAVLVDRGWLPDSERPNKGNYDISGAVEIAGFGALSQTLPGSQEFAKAEPQEEWYRVDIEAIQQQMPYDLLPFYVLQAASDDSKLPYRSDLEIDLSEGSHLSYAAQWFIFSIGLGIGYLAYVNKRMKEKIEE